jgi:hypothetical protein
MARDDDPPPAADHGLRRVIVAAWMSRHERDESMFWLSIAYAAAGTDGDPLALADAAAKRLINLWRTCGGMPTGQMHQDFVQQRLKLLAAWHRANPWRLRRLRAVSRRWEMQDLLPAALAARVFLRLTPLDAARMFPMSSAKESRQWRKILEKVGRCPM